MRCVANNIGNYRGVIAAKRNAETWDNISQRFSFRELQLLISRYADAALINTYIFISFMLLMMDIKLSFIKLTGIIYVF